MTFNVTRVLVIFAFYVLELVTVDVTPFVLHRCFTLCFTPSVPPLFA